VDSEYSDQDILHATDRSDWHIDDITAAQERLRLGEPILPETLSNWPAGIEVISPVEFLIRALVTMIAPSSAWCADCLCFFLSTIRAGGWRAALTMLTSRD